MALPIDISGLRKRSRTTRPIEQAPPPPPDEIVTQAVKTPITTVKPSAPLPVSGPFRKKIEEKGDVGIATPAAGQAFGEKIIEKGDAGRITPAAGEAFRKKVEEKKPTKEEPIDVTQAIIDPVVGPVIPIENVMTDIDQINQLAVDLALGKIEDPVFNKAINTEIQLLGLMNQAQMEDLEQRIAGDPNLRAQGAGLGFLMMMNREQNFNVGNMLSRLTVASMDRLIDMQRFGIQTALQIDAQKKADERQAIQDLIAAGDFESAATALNSNINNILPGISATITAQDLQKRDPTWIQDSRDMLTIIQNTALTDPEAAIALMEDFIARDPDIWGNVDARAFVEGLASGEFSDRLPEIERFQVEITTNARSEAPWGSVQGIYESLQNGGLIDYEPQGRNLTLEEANTLYEEFGMVPVDSLEDLDAEDFTELGQLKDYSDRKVDTSEAGIFKAVKDFILSDPSAERWFNPDFFAGGQNAIDNYVSQIVLGGTYTIDPATGIAVPDLEAFNGSFWEVPEAYSAFYTWPEATFGEDGNLATDAEGNLLSFYEGGDPYDTQDDGSGTFQETEEDKDLDTKFGTYRQNGGQLDAQSWYFATAGGSRPVDETKIPDGVGPQNEGGGPDDNFLNIGVEAELAALTLVEFNTRFDNDAEFRTQIFGFAPKLNTTQSIIALNQDTVQEILDGVTKGIVSIDGVSLTLRNPGFRSLPEGAAFTTFTADAQTADGVVFGPAESVAIWAVDENGQPTGLAYSLLLSGPNQGMIVTGTQDELISPSDFAEINQRQQQEASGGT